MARKSLRPHLNQIRAWVRQGRTDAWIAHQLDVTASQLRDFRRRNGLTADGETPPTDSDLRDEIEAEIEAAVQEEEAAAPDEPEEEDEDEDEEESAEERAPRRRRSSTGDGEGDGDGQKRRRRRGGRGRTKKRAATTLEGTFDHGKEGYGLWLDAAVKDEPVYTENWAGKRKLRVTIEPDRIVLEREGDSNGKPAPKRNRSRSGSGSRGGGRGGGGRGGSGRGGSSRGGGGRSSRSRSN